MLRIRLRKEAFTNSATSGLVIIFLHSQFSSE